MHLFDSLVVVPLPVDPDETLRRRFVGGDGNEDIFGYLYNNPKQQVISLYLCRRTFPSINSSPSLQLSKMEQLRQQWRDNDSAVTFK